MTAKLSGTFSPSSFCVSTGHVSTEQTVPAFARLGAPVASGRVRRVASDATLGGRGCQFLDCDSVWRGATPPASG